MITHFPTDYAPDLQQQIQPIYCPHKFSWLTLICYHHDDENDNRRPLLSLDGDMLFIKDVLSTDQFIDLDPLIDSYAKNYDVVFISFNARMLKYISLMAQIKPLGIKILCANKDTSIETPHLTVDGHDMEFFYQEITPECFSFDDAFKWFKSKHDTASIIEFSTLAIRQLVALGQHTKEGSRENNSF